MREIKFRGWNGKEFVDPKYIACYGDGATTWMGSDITKDLKIMQFTGLKDKNGKEIYEWNILRIYEHEFSPMDFIIKWSEINLGWELESVKRDSDGVPINWFDYSSLNGFESDSEIIGNIYENPELLEVKE